MVNLLKISLLFFVTVLVSNSLWSQSCDSIKLVEDSSKFERFVLNSTDRLYGISLNMGTEVFFADGFNEHIKVIVNDSLLIDDTLATNDRTAFTGWKIRIPADNSVLEVPFEFHIENSEVRFLLDMRFNSAIISYSHIECRLQVYYTNRYTDWK